LGATGREQQQFRFAPHRVPGLRVQEELSNSRSDLRKARFVHSQDGSTSLLEAAHQSPDLARFSARFTPFKCDKQTRHPLADKPPLDEPQLEKLQVPVPVSGRLSVVSC
jgi:hypothetical protein